MTAHPYAGIFRRFFSGLVDLLIIIIPFALLALLFDPIQMSIEASLNYNYLADVGFTRTLRFSNPKMLISILIALIIYLSIFQKYFGASLGQLIFGARVKSLTSSSPSLRSFFLKNIFLPLDVFVTGLPLMVRSPRHQTLGDSISHLVVIKSKYINLPLKDRKLSSLQKLSGGFLWFLTLFILSLNLLTLQRASLTSKIAQDYFQTLKKGIQSEDLSETYEQSAQLLKDQLSSDEMSALILGESNLVEIFSKASEFIPLRWLMMEDVVNISGRTDTGEGALVSLFYEDGKWMPVSVQIIGNSSKMESEEKTVTNEKVEAKNIQDETVNTL